MSSSMFGYEESIVVRTAWSSCNALIHILMGVTVAIPILFAVVKKFNSTSAPDDIIMLHIILCVLGYQLLMPQSFLSLFPYNTWSSGLKQVNQRRAHWVLQLLACGLAFTGSIVIMIYKDVNFNTVHGQLGLTALIFTSINLFTGVACLFARSLNQIIPSYVSKLTHIVLGIVAFCCASACLCYGYNKNSFRTWTGDQVTTGIIALTGIFTLIMLINPLITMCKKVYSLIKKVRNR